MEEAKLSTLKRFRSRNENKFGSPTQMNYSAYSAEILGELSG
jgi:hypothetical protein